MSKREDIAKHVAAKIAEVRYVKSVTRQPRTLDEVARSDFPHVLVETANETRSNSSFGQTIRQESELDILINCVVRGADIDSQRNLIAEAIEKKLHEDATMGGLVMDSYVTEVAVNNATEDTASYGTIAVVYTVLYHYDRTRP